MRNQLRSERNRGDELTYIEQLEEEMKELERLKEYWYFAALRYRRLGEEE